MRSNRPRMMKESVGRHVNLLAAGGADGASFSMVVLAMIHLVLGQVVNPWFGSEFFF
jgi:hypothetical protein